MHWWMVCVKANYVIHMYLCNYVLQHSQAIINARLHKEVLTRWWPGKEFEKISLLRKLQISLWRCTVPVCLKINFINSISGPQSTFTQWVSHRRSCSCSLLLISKFFLFRIFFHFSLIIFCWISSEM